MEEEENYELKDLNTDWLNIDPKKCKFELDALQNEMLNFYLRNDHRFRIAFNTNWTPHFIQYMKDKARLHEPLHLSIIGKTRCHPRGTKVMLANGEWKNIEEMEIGDEIISPQKDGTNIFSKVIGNSKHLVDETYKIYERNRKEKLLYECSKNHIIPLYHRANPRINKKIADKRRADWQIVEYEAEKLASLGNRVFRATKSAISSFEIKRFKDKVNCEIEPYTLGAFLGDGHFTQNLGITGMDDEIINEISKYYKIDHTYQKKDTPAKTYTFYHNSKLWNQLEKAGLRFHKAGEKFIPKDALYSDSDYRKKLLAGLFDTDGHLSKECSYSITSKSKQLVEDIKFLVYSLGGRASIIPIRKSIKSIGFTGNYYRITFYLGKLIDEIPIKLKRKIRNKSKFFYITPNRTAIRLEKVKEEKLVYGIEIDSSSKWYITDEFMVTHNSGKSYTALSLCIIHALLNGRFFDERYICGNSYEFIEKLKEMAEEDLINSIFLIDEEKKTVQGFGSTGRKMKILDVQNIIAINNISTISLTPDSWSNSNADYGCRSFGRDFEHKICRFMIYNLTESTKTGLPLGMIYLPIFTSLLPEKYAKILEGKYIKKKREWVNLEMRGEADAIAIIHKKTAESFMRDDQFLGLKKKNERKSYIQQKLGSEWSVGEIETVLQLTNMMRNGVNFDK